MVNDLQLSKVVREVHQNKGSLNDVVLAFHPDIKVESEEFEKAKGAIQSQITDLRRKLKAQCEAKGIDVERVNIVLPKFKGGGRTSTRANDLKELLDQMCE